MHVHVLDFNEHVHKEDSVPRGTRMHFQKAHVTLAKKNPSKKSKQKMTKTRSNEDVFQN